MLDADGVRGWMAGMAKAVDRERDRLTELDAAIGDGDHGISLQRGFTAVEAALSAASAGTPGAVLMLAGRTLVSSVGGASGPLYGSALRAMGKALADSGGADAEQVVAGLAAARDAIAALGGARGGDKTMLDAWIPAVDGFDSAVAAGEALQAAALAAAAAAEGGAEATVPLEARKGRASYLGPRSVGHLDPGAASTVLLFRALADAVQVTGG
ncbi:dihydroxyacetone kinase subunit DhaL [Streptacidiphilus carbonis]|uniref:dihydroxyacetone kinase subunit DhaL n=1 Tax=Streptacidiphilus carbonis TaxID=105422 RepID=UPI0005AADD36|nr:dihydroxyacetone kinase subunit DhaL [Streptacidiphilus carbonis]